MPLGASGIPALSNEVDKGWVCMPGGFPTHPQAFHSVQKSQGKLGVVVVRGLPGSFFWKMPLSAAAVNAKEEEWMVIFSWTMYEFNSLDKFKERKLQSLFPKFLSP